MLAVMGVMMVGGLIFWMFTGHSHMSGMHGGRHSAAPEVRSEERHGAAHEAHDAPEGYPGGKRDDASERDRQRTRGGYERNP